MKKDAKATRSLRLVKSARWVIGESLKHTLLIVVGAYLMGLMLALILGANEVGIVFSTGFGGLALLVMTIILTIVTLTIHYPTLIRFGTSRPTALIAVTFKTLALPLLLSAALALLTLPTAALTRADASVGNILAVLIMLNLLCHTFGLFASVLIYRFGQYGLTTAWLIFVFLFTFLPILVSRLYERSELVAQIADYAVKNPGMLLLFVLFASAIIDVIILRILYKTTI